MTEEAWRALAALRKPMNDNEAKLLVGAACVKLSERALVVVEAGMRIKRTLTKEELLALPGKAEAAEAGQRLVDALTGKKP